MIPTGRPATATAYVDGRPIVTQVGGYNPAGQATRTRVTVPEIVGMEGLAGRYDVTSQYHLDGSLQSVLLPRVGGLSREAIVYDYDQLGLPAGMVGSLTTTGDVQTYVDSAVYTAWGELAQRSLGPADGLQTYQSFSYEDGTRRPVTFRLSRDAVGATNVAHLGYDFDDGGNIRSIVDAVDSEPGQPERQCFVALRHGAGGG